MKLKEEVISAENRYLAEVYMMRPIVLVRGKGAIVWDSEGKEYIDCMGGYGVCLVGHCHPRVIEAIKGQAEKLITCHGSIYTDVRSKFVEKVSKLMPPSLDNFFLCNSGAEAVEAAIKLARKYTERKEIVAMMRGYHGKTMGALSATWGRKYRESFEPLLPGFKHIPFGNLEKAKEAVTSQTAAVIVEPIQGEGGVYVAPNGYLRGLREICDDVGSMLILDEIQTGLGRTGKIFAFEHWNVIPDILCLAKGIAGGIPMGLIAAGKDVMGSFSIGEHTTTFGGNPLACAAASATIDVIVEEKLPERAAEVGKYFKESLEGLRRKFRVVREVRGLGLMLGMELRLDCRDIIFGALKKGVILLDAGVNVLRFLPPLIIKKKHVDVVIKVLKSLLEERYARSH